MCKDIRDKHLNCPIYHLVNPRHPPLFSRGQFFRFHAVSALKITQNLYHLPVCFQRKILATNVKKVFPFGAGVIKISHAVNISLNAGPAGIDHIHRPADDENIGEAGDNGADGRLKGGLGFFVHMNTVNVLRSINGPQKSLKALHLKCMQKKNIIINFSHSSLQQNFKRHQHSNCRYSDSITWLLHHVKPSKYLLDSHTL